MLINLECEYSQIQNEKRGLVGWDRYLPTQICEAGALSFASSLVRHMCPVSIHSFVGRREVPTMNDTDFPTDYIT